MRKAWLLIAIVGASMGGVALVQGLRPAKLRQFNRLRPGMKAAEMAALFPHSGNAYCDLRELSDARKLTEERPTEANALSGTLWLLDETSIDNDREAVLDVVHGRIAKPLREKKWHRLIPAMKAGALVTSVVKNADPKLSIRFSVAPSSNLTVRDVYHNRLHDLHRFSGELTSMAYGSWFEYNLSIRMKQGRIVKTEVQSTPSIFR